MAVNLFNIIKWINMLRGKSIYHVKQDEGKYFKRKEIGGYYNNLTEKVSKSEEKDFSIPKVKIGRKQSVYLPTAVFQYGLGAYDLYIETGERMMLERMLACAEWALNNQELNGGWKTFEFENEAQPYSSMAQGEGASLLIRAYKETEQEKYFFAAQKAVYFLITPINEGGTALYEGDDVYLYEYTYEPLILNGWIFSFWGLWDYCLVAEDDKVRDIRDRTLVTMKRKLPEFDCGFWSKYEDGKRICSPFYHDLHIAQLRVMYELTSESCFLDYAKIFEAYKANRFYKCRAFIIKCIQKIME